MSHVRALLRRVRVRGFATERALVVDETGAHEMREFASLAELPQQDSDASVTVRVTHSTINYKDAMILQGRPGLVPAWPIVPGIDAAGVVVASESVVGASDTLCSSSQGVRPGMPSALAARLTARRADLLRSLRGRAQLKLSHAFHVVAIARSPAPKEDFSLLRHWYKEGKCSRGSVVMNTTAIEAQIGA